MITTIFSSLKVNKLNNTGQIAATVPSYLPIVAFTVEECTCNWNITAPEAAT